MLNIEWMLQVEEDMKKWNDNADDDDDDDIDHDEVEIGEENLDRLAQRCSQDDQLEEVFLPSLFKILRNVQQLPTVTWKHHRACVMAVSQVSEHIEEEPWIDQSIDYISQFFEHEHPRVRDASFIATAQICYDHEPYCQESHHSVLLPAIDKALDDPYVRVAATACSAFSSLGSELDDEDLLPHVDSLMAKILIRLGQQETKSMSEQCLSGLAVIAEVSADSFGPYYKTVMPILKELVTAATDESLRTLRGKAFECIGLIGEAVGKEVFLADGRDVMQGMMALAQNGFASDDPLRESVHEASRRIASTLGKEFKPYVQVLLPGIISVLSNRPQEIDPASLPDDEDSDREDMSLSVVGNKVLGLKTTVLSEMEDALSLVCTLMRALDEEFAEFLPGLCQTLLPLLDFELSEDLREEAYRTWHSIAECARHAADKNLMSLSDVRELVGTFLKATLVGMSNTPAGDDLDNSMALGKLQAQANGVMGIVTKAGVGILAKEEVLQLTGVAVELIERVSLAKKDPIEASMKTGHQKDDDDDSSDSSSEDDGATRQSVRFALADMVGSLMRVCRTEFAEVGLQAIMPVVQRFLQDDASEGDKSLALYITDEMVTSLGELSVPCWNLFMERALRAIQDKCPAVRQYAASTIGNASRQPIFAQMAPAAAQFLAQEIQKNAARHKRRRAVKEDAKQIALAVDSCIRAFGMICECQEQNVGGNAAAAWTMWLDNLPLRYDQEQGKKAHKQLLDLVVREHPQVISQLPKAIKTFATVHRTRFSNSNLDKEIAAVICRLPDLSNQVAVELPEKPRKRIQYILNNA